MYRGIIIPGFLRWCRFRPSTVSQTRTASLPRRSSAQLRCSCGKAAAAFGEALKCCEDERAAPGMKWGECGPGVTYPFGPFAGLHLPGIGVVGNRKLLGAWLESLLLLGQELESHQTQQWWVGSSAVQWHHCSDYRNSTKYLYFNNSLLACMNLRTMA